MTLVAIALLPVFALVVRPAIFKISKLSVENVKYRKGIDTALARVFGAIELVKSNSTEVEETKRFSEISEECQKSNTRILIKSDAINVIFQLGVFAVLGIVLVALLYFQGEVLIARFTDYLVYLYLLKRIVDISHYSNSLRTRYARLSAAAADLLQVFDQSSDLSLKEGTREFTAFENSIVCENLSFSYQPGVVALASLSLRFDKGKTTAVVGKSGSGKSTLVKLLLRLYDCPAKSIFVDGVDLREFELSSFHSRIAYVNQSNNMFWGTLRENLCYGIEGKISDDDILVALRAAELTSFLSSLPEGLDTFIGEHGVTISGGEAQRIAIARAMLKQVEIVILDEATSALDAKTEEAVQTAFSRLSQGKTVIVIAHNFTSLRHADKIVVIEDGQVIEEGSREELLANEGLFARLWDAQQLNH
ncbi:UNVERIFIED_CONTAM: hypothetical protein GTU68_051673 [Idotea baltica]|nr:hypothetical protein [Idotea baltica]